MRRSASSQIGRAREFSVDDSRDELTLDRRLAKTVSGHSAVRQGSTLRRRPTAATPSLSRVESTDAEGESDQARKAPAAAPVGQQSSDESDETLRVEEEEEQEAPDDDENEDDDGDNGDDDADLSDSESFTLKDRQEAINETHPFGIRIWKPALYKKDRSVQATAEGDIHSAPGGNVNHWLFLFNGLWTMVFGWWLAIIVLLAGTVCHLLSFLPGGADYGHVLWALAFYLFYPFGKYVRLEHDEAYLDEDEGEGRSISEYERWQTGDLEEGRLFFGPTTGPRSLIGQRRDSVDSAEETDALLGRPTRNDDRDGPQSNRVKNRPFGRGKWNAGRVIYYTIFYGLITPLFLLVSAICWFLVFTIPMGRVLSLLLNHLRRHPLALSFHSDSHYSRSPSEENPATILLCTYRAVGLKYWKYTIDGTNIFLINLLALVAFTIFDFYVLRESLHVPNAIASSGFIFVLALFSIIPLAYFIGQAVASISAQSTMGVGATVNAFFSTVVEVFLYCVALDQGKAQLVEGSIIGSIFAGILLLPGISMCFGAIKRKTQRFNVRSAGVTSTMLMFAIIGSFGPTLFYQIYGSHQLNCHQCVKEPKRSQEQDCRRCYFDQSPAIHDEFFQTAVQPYIFFSAALLFLSYIIGLLFTLRTHASMIWSTEADEKKTEKMEQAAQQVERRRSSLTNEHPPGAKSATAALNITLNKDNIKDTQLYKRILGQSLKQAGISVPSGDGESSIMETAPTSPQLPHITPPKNDDSPKNTLGNVQIPGLSAEDNKALVRQVAEMAATAATVATRDATRAIRKNSSLSLQSASKKSAHQAGTLERPGTGHRANTTATITHETEDAHAAEAGGHDAPNWSRNKSVIILLTATVAYAVIAEILVDTVDSVLEHVDIDEKFLGITLFALVPNTTEFLNAISFAMNGNIALSMEIGSAYALQVMLLQVPALVLFSAVHSSWLDPSDVVDHTFSLLFPQWDMVTVILGLFLMNYVVAEGKSNYFKGSMLVLSYLVVVVGFYFSGYNNMDVSSSSGSRCGCVADDS